MNSHHHFQSAASGTPEKNSLVTSDPRTWPLFNGLTETDFRAIEQEIALREVERGDFVFMPGDPAETMYLIVHGRIKISRLMPDGREQILYIYNIGDFVGGLNLLKGHEYLYYGEALEKSEIAAIDKPLFDRFALDKPIVLQRILEKSYERIRWAEDLIARLSSANAEMKAAALLLSLIDYYGIRRDDEILLDLSINREEMGSYAGLTRETMTRKLNDFRTRGYLDFEGNRMIVIKDLPALKRLTYLA